MRPTPKALLTLALAYIGVPLPIVNDARKRIAIYIVNDIAWLIPMTEKKIRKENAKTRYDAKMPTVSFRVSLDELNRLDRLREEGATFRELILNGAGIMENAQAREKRLLDSERKAIKEEAIRGALSRVALCRCERCGKLVYFDLTNQDHRQTIAETLERRMFFHSQCQ